MGMGMGMPGVAQGGDLQVQLLLEQLQTIEGEEYLNLVAKGSGRGGQDERGIAPVQGTLGGNNSQLFLRHGG
jgi:hypothetical protein